MVTSAESALDIGMLAESACDPPTPSPPRCGLLTPASAALVSSALGWSVRSQGGMVASSESALEIGMLPEFVSAEETLESEKATAVTAAITSKLSEEEYKGSL